MSHSSSSGAPGLSGLEPLVGKWHTEGLQHESPLGPAAPFAAVEVFEWLDGGQFLIHRLDGHFGNQPAACIEVLGKREDGQFFAHTFYNDGRRNDWVVKEDGSTLVWSGAWSTSSGSSLQVRCTVSFEDAGNTLVSKWEQSPDGQTWQVFLDARGTKAQPLPSTSIGGP
jgi:hypothetical protein